MSIKYDILADIMKLQDMIGAQAGVEVNIMPVVGDAGSLNFNPAEIPPSIPLLPLRNAIVFP